MGAPSDSRRPALDGLRALAVLLVFAFHVNAPGFGGGFLGVDLFFVLSGYLITSLLLVEVEKTGGVALGAFWSRRVRRLFPAFVVVIAAVMIWAATRAPAFLREKLRNDVLASVFYVGNWRFIATSSYFENDESISPLQHVWSLAIEEQFYFVWPVLVALCAFVAKRRALPIARVVGMLAWGGVLASAIALAVIYSPMHPERAYMGTDTKAFEPLAGAALACLFTSPRVRAWCERRRTPLGLAGLVGTLAIVAWTGRAAGISPWYFGGGALLFVLASAALIAAVESGPSILARAFSLWPIEKTGAISYAIYLWHRPLMLLIIGQSSAWKPLLALAAFGATMAISIASYFVVEKPVRYGRLAKIFSAKRLVWILPLLLALVGGSAAASLKPPPKQGFTVVLVGDSVPKRLVPYVAAEAEKRHWFAYNACEGGCSTFPSTVVDPQGQTYNDSQLCFKLVTDLQRAGIEKYQPDVIVWWSRYDIADRIDPDGVRLVAGSEAFWERQKIDLRQEIDRLTAGGARLVVVEQDRPGKGMLERCSLAGECHFFLRQLLTHYDWAERWNAMLRETARVDSRIKVISMDDVYCHDQNVPCDDKLGAKWARPDGSHFSEDSGPIVARAMLDRLGAP